jgi:hypothetical protein
MAAIPEIAMTQSLKRELRTLDYTAKAADRQEEEDFPHADG